MGLVGKLTRVWSRREFRLRSGSISCVLALLVLLATSLVGGVKPLGPRWHVFLSCYLSAQHLTQGSARGCAGVSSRGQCSPADDHAGIPGKGLENLSLVLLSTNFYPKSQSLFSLPPHPLCQAGTSSRNAC